MEYIIMIGIALAVFFILFLIIKVKAIRDRANALFLEAEKYIEANDNKFEYVCSNLYKYMPNVMKLFISQELLRDIVQAIYDKSRKIARDLLDDGKLNKSYK